MQAGKWPSLREELDLIAGPRLGDGQPTWTLHDPTRNQFFRVDWPTFEILQRWSYGDPAAIAQSVTDSTPLSLTVNDVVAVVEFLSNNQLLKPEPLGAAPKFAEMLHKRQGDFWKWLLHNYLFIRLPLVRPDDWLGRWLPSAAFFFTRTFFWLTLAALCLGLLGVGRQWDVFTTMLVDSFNLEGLLSYGVALIGVKILHELGHAFTAKRYGCRVPAMGVAFVVMWPMAYTDTNEVWRLTDNRQRLAVAVAGISTELIIAAWATLAWVLLPDGPWRGGAFILATTTWVATLAINASPFLRFDGYYILSDLLDMPNLHERCFALARWWLREVLFRLGEPVPEHVNAARRRAMIAFAFVTWLYRLVVFVGIAVLVYSYFFKALGLFLFLVEIAWFVMLPLNAEVKAWTQRREAIAQSGRARTSTLILVLLTASLFVPWPGKIEASAILRPAEFWAFFAPEGVRLDALPFGNGDTVKQGDVVVRMSVPDLESKGRVAEAKLSQAEAVATASVFDDDNRRKLLVNRELAATAQAQLASVNTEAERYTPSAPFDGVVRNMDPDLKPGQWLSRREPIGLVVHDETQRVVETWLDEEAVQRVSVGASASFIDDAGLGPVLRLKVMSIDRDISPVLPRGELSAQAGGHLLVRESKKQLIPERASYRVVLSLVDPPVARAQPLLRSGEAPPQAFEFARRGRLLLDASGQAPAWPYLKRFISVLIREFGS